MAGNHHCTVLIHKDVGLRNDFAVSFRLMPTVYSGSSSHNFTKYTGSICPMNIEDPEIQRHKFYRKISSSPTSFLYSDDLILTPTQTIATNAKADDVSQTVVKYIPNRDRSDFFTNKIIKIIPSFERQGNRVHRYVQSVFSGDRVDRRLLRAKKLQIDHKSNNRDLATKDVAQNTDRSKKVDRGTPAPQITPRSEKRHRVTRKMQRVPQQKEPRDTSSSETKKVSQNSPKSSNKYRKESLGKKKIKYRITREVSKIFPSSDEYESVSSSDKGKRIARKLPKKSQNAAKIGPSGDKGDSTKKRSKKSSSEDSLPTWNDLASESIAKIGRWKKWFRRKKNYLFGLGHMYNDLSAAMWFSFMMLYFQTVLQMKAVVAGAMMLIGQVVDAVATPVSGVLIDKFATKKSWYLTGCILVALTFPLLFVRCWGCYVSAEQPHLDWWMPVYYGTLIFIFQTGWAIVQIAHLAMIPVISDSMKVRAELTSIRYTASVLSSLCVYLVTWLVLKSDYSASIGPTDDYKFRNVAFVIAAIGITAFMTFFLFFKIPKKTPKALANGSAKLMEGETGAEKEKQWKLIDFLKMPLLYQVSLLYVFSRLYWSLSMVYIPLFLEERLTANPSAGSDLVASVPLVLYLASLAFSLILKRHLNACGTKGMYLIGSVLSLLSSLWIGILIDPHASIIHVYLVAIFIGAGTSITFVSSLCITANLIGSHSEQSAAIYSIVTFADKLITGVAVIGIQHFKCTDHNKCPEYYRGVLTYACGTSAILGLLSLAITKIKKKPDNAEEP